MTRTVDVLAPAKVNLFLRILHRRSDGYRELETLFQTVSLSDRVSVTIHDVEDARVDLDVVGADVGSAAENLAVRAVDAFRRETGFRQRISIRLEKHIPAGAGLGGGSSDAAAVLRALAAMTELTSEEGLEGAARDLGSDVPFFLVGQPASLGRGRGEVLEVVGALPSRSLVIALPPVHLSTVEAYAGVNEARRGAVDDPHGGPRALDPHTLGWDALGSLAENDFEAMVSAGHPAVRASLDGLKAQGAEVALLSGSGAACFGLFSDAPVARRAAAALTERLGWPCVAATTLTAPVEVRA